MKLAFIVWLLAVASIAFVAGLMCAMDHLVYITKVV
jgi:hypothetical protein